VRIEHRLTIYREIARNEFREVKQYLSRPPEDGRRPRRPSGPCHVVGEMLPLRLETLGGAD
jgi:hypothetical protein